MIPDNEIENTREVVKSGNFFTVTSLGVLGLLSLIYMMLKR